MDSTRIGSAIFTTVIVIIWIALKAGDCRSDDYSYDYGYTPSFSYTPPTSYQNVLDRTNKLLEQMQDKDRDWRAQVETTDPVAIASTPKKTTPCQALDRVMDQTPTWNVQVSEIVLVGGGTKSTVLAPYPLYVMHEHDLLPALSPEAITRGTLLVEKLVEGSTPSAPTLTTSDLLIQTAIMPKPARGQKRGKHAIKPGTPIVKAWIYDHREGRVVCAGVRALPDLPKGDGTEGALQLTEAQIEKLVRELPGTLQTIALEGIEVQDAPQKKKT